MRPLGFLRGKKQSDAKSEANIFAQVSRRIDKRAENWAEQRAEPQFGPQNGQYSGHSFQAVDYFYRTYGGNPDPRQENAEHQSIDQNALAQDPQAETWHPPMVDPLAADRMSSDWSAQDNGPNDAWPNDAWPNDAWPNEGRRNEGPFYDARPSYDPVSAPQTTGRIPPAPSFVPHPKVLAQAASGASGASGATDWATSAPVTDRVTPTHPVHQTRLAVAAKARRAPAPQGVRNKARDPSRDAPRDPAPSRLTYRLNRLWLTPFVRVMARVGVPAFLVSFAAGFYLSNERTVETISLALMEVRRSIEERPEFMVHMMAVNGASTELAADIREIVPLDFPISSFDVDLDGMIAAVADLDAVASVDLAIRPGGVLDMNVVERQAAVVWRSRSAMETLDEFGNRVGPLDDRAARADLPLILGDGADAAVEEALQLVAAAEQVLPGVQGLVRKGARRWDLVLTSGQRILLPEDDALRALNRVLAEHSSRQLLAREVASVDMRNPRRPTLRLTEQGMAALAAKRGLPVLTPVGAQEQEADG